MIEYLAFGALIGVALVSGAVWMSAPIRRSFQAPERREPPVELSSLYLRQQGTERITLGGKS